MKRSLSRLLCLAPAALAGGWVVGGVTAGCSAVAESPSPNGRGGSAGHGGAGGSGNVGTGGVAGNLGKGGTATGGSGGVTTGSGGAPGTGGSAGKGGTGAGGTTGTDGAAGAGGAPVTGGAAGSGGAAGIGGAAGKGGGSVDAGGPTADASAVRFSFFVTSMQAMKDLSGSANGFGGDLRFGEADGLTGADKICTQAAERGMAGNGKTWRAFLSVSKGPAGTQVNAIDRVGNGPWYDRMGRLLAMNKTALLQARPQGADPAIINDLPNEYGVPNQFPDGTGTMHDNHATLTGSGPDGKLWSTGLASTCKDWTSAVATDGKPHVGYTFPRGTTNNWISIMDEPGCAAGMHIIQTGGADPNNPIVGSSGGYGGFYCFALTP